MAKETSFPTDMRSSSDRITELLEANNVALEKYRALLNEVRQRNAALKTFADGVSDLEIRQALKGFIVGIQ